jgi:hypothetical protein
MISHAHAHAYEGHGMLRPFARLPSNGLRLFALLGHHQPLLPTLPTSSAAAATSTDAPRGSKYICTNQTCLISPQMSQTYNIYAQPVWKGPTSPSVPPDEDRSRAFLVPASLFPGGLPRLPGSPVTNLLPPFLQGFKANCFSC